MFTDLLFEQQGQLGLVTLNRPQALNALTLDMVLELQKQLSEWKEDQSIKAVVVRAVPGNAFCAGGDIRSLYFAGQETRSEQMQFFWNEYRVNHFIHHFGKPYISLMDGITMGGGVGISMHGSHPIASERLVFAMPETGIGFFPDIGASHLLSRCPGYSGIYLGLTGNRIGPKDAMTVGLVRQVVSSERMPDLLDELLQVDLSQDAHQRVDDCINRFAMGDALEEASQLKPLIDDCFAKPTVELIFQYLENTEGAWAASVLHTLEKKSPFSLKVTLAQLQKARGLSLADCLKMDYTIVSHFIHGSDFYEGVRALLIDKDKKPRWQPARLDLVTDEMVVNYFEKSGEGLTF